MKGEMGRIRQIITMTWVTAFLMTVSYVPLYATTQAGGDGGDFTFSAISSGAIPPTPADFSTGSQTLTQSSPLISLEVSSSVAAEAVQAVEQEVQEDPDSQVAVVNEASPEETAEGQEAVTAEEPEAAAAENPEDTALALQSLDDVSNEGADDTSLEPVIGSTVFKTVMLKGEKVVLELTVTQKHDGLLGDETVFVYVVTRPCHDNPDKTCTYEIDDYQLSNENELDDALTKPLVEGLFEEPDMNVDGNNAAGFDEPGYEVV